MTPVIEARGLTKMYGASRGIEDINLAIPAGQIFGYLGPNGAGKTTTIRLMLGFLRATRGEMKLFGERTGTSAHKHRARIGYLPGELGLPESYTGDYLLRYYASLSRSNAPLRDWLCKELRFTPHDLRRRVKLYSKGMKQKLGIVQALQHDPELIVLDEPTSGLDPLVQNAFFEILKELRDRGRTIFFSSHVLSEVQRLCDSIGVVREGHLVLNSTLHELAARADRNLWVKLRGSADDTGIIPAGEVPNIGRARFLRTEPGGWLVYHATAGDSPRILHELANLKPIDFRLEPAFEDSFLRLYGVQTT